MDFRPFKPSAGVFGRRPAPCSPLTPMRSERTRSPERRGRTHKHASACALARMPKLGYRDSSDSRHGRGSSRGSGSSACERLTATETASPGNIARQSESAVDMAQVPAHAQSCVALQLFVCSYLVQQFSHGTLWTCCLLPEPQAAYCPVDIARLKSICVDCPALPGASISSAWS